MLAKDKKVTDEYLEDFFLNFKMGIVGEGDTCTTPVGNYPLIYADWIAEGRMYRPIEEKIINNFGPIVANPHSCASYTGQKITAAYLEARDIIKKHINAGSNDILITVGHGMTGAMERLIRILDQKFNISTSREKPVVFITHMEHHSNHAVWNQWDVELVVVPPDKKGVPDPEALRSLLEAHKDKKLLIGSFTACSNVTGIVTPYHKLASVMHQYRGYALVDFAASAPYVSINMKPKNPSEQLDAVLFAPHKFLGGPGSCGILAVNKILHSGKPSISGGGNVKWTLPPGDYGFTTDPDMQEDSGTPGYLQTIRAAMAIVLKEKMGIENISIRENFLLKKAQNYLKKLKDIELLIPNEINVERIGILSFNIKNLHYNMVVRLLNDRFGIQTRGGWSCASTYSYYLLNVSGKESKALTDRIKGGDYTGKPGWVRLSLHPTMANKELEYCLEAIKQITIYGDEWKKDYFYNKKDNEYYPHRKESTDTDELKLMFKLND